MNIMIIDYDDDVYRNKVIEKCKSKKKWLI